MNPYNSGGNEYLDVNNGVDGDFDQLPLHRFAAQESTGNAYFQDACDHIAYFHCNYPTNRPDNRPDNVESQRLSHHNDQQREEMWSELSSSSSPSNSSRSRRTRSLVSSSWNERFQELVQFREAYDHCFVPHNFPANPKLSQWVRKQRHQRKRKEKGLHSTLSDERQEMLTNAGFIWDSHRAQWQERYQSLEMFQLHNGHCNVPSNFHDSSLSNWVKNQRKQFKLYQGGLNTAMDQERIRLLNALGFDWNPRGL